MEPTTTLQAIKTTIILATGLSRDALHIYFGLAVFLLSAAVLRKPLRSYAPWLVVWAAALFGELLDMRDDLGFYGYWRWDAGVHDVLNTMFWPSVLMLLARHSLFFHAARPASTTRSCRRRLQALLFRLFNSPRG
jgi:hypothetical protein